MRIHGSYNDLIKNGRFAELQEEAAEQNIFDRYCVLTDDPFQARYCIAHKVSIMHAVDIDNTYLGPLHKLHPDQIQFVGDNIRSTMRFVLGGDYGNIFITPVKYFRWKMLSRKYRDNFLSLLENLHRDHALFFLTGVDSPKRLIDWKALGGSATLLFTAGRSTEALRAACEHAGIPSERIGLAFDTLGFNEHRAMESERDIQNYYSGPIK